MGINTIDENLPKILKLHENNLEEVVFDMRVAGTTFVEESKELLKLLKEVPREKLILVLSREPNNEYDPNAVRVGVKVEGYDNSRFIGYIPREYSEMVSYVISHNDDYKLLITRPTLCGGVEGKENIGVFFNMKILRRGTSENV